jgi:hypothetical protein
MYYLGNMTDTLQYSLQTTGKLSCQCWIAKTLGVNDSLAISWQEQVNFQWDDDDEVCYIY